MKKSVRESIATLQEHLFEAERKGNKRKADAIKIILKRLQKRKVA